MNIRNGEAIIKLDALNEIRDWFVNEVEAGDEALEIWIDKIDQSIVFVG